MSLMNAVALRWFRATNKHQHFSIFIVFVWFSHKSWIRGLWKSRVANFHISWQPRWKRTGFGWTFPSLDLERMNPNNPTQINRLLDMVNGVKCCDENVQTLLESGAIQANTQSWDVITFKKSSQNLNQLFLGSNFDVLTSTAIERMPSTFLMGLAPGLEFWSLSLARFSKSKQGKKKLCFRWKGWDAQANHF